MPLTLLGIDEAGYGPILGPLCVGLASVRIDDWSEGQPAPDLWQRLASAVCTKPNDKRHRVAIADSKRLKLPSDTARPRHPLMHLERGVLAALAARGSHAPTDRSLFDALGVELPGQRWYDQPPLALPLAHDGSAIRIAGNMLARACTDARVTLDRLDCEIIDEATLNRLSAQHGTKAAATAEAIGRHLRRAWTELDADAPPARVVIDRQGGRSQYGGWLAAMLPESIGAGQIVALEESDERSRYEVLDTQGRRRMVVHLLVEAEQSCLCVALASMIAKFTRELLMARLNRYWLARAADRGVTGIRPTAGYFTDGRRWLDDMRPAMSDEDRAGLIRTV